MAYNPLALGPRLIGRRTALNLNSTSDQPITITLPPNTTKYSITRIIVTNATGTLTLAAGGIYTAASKGGTAVVVAGQAYSALTTAAKVLNPVLAVTDTRTETILYFSLSVAAGSAASADIFIIGDVLS